MATSPHRAAAAAITAMADHCDTNDDQESGDTTVHLYPCISLYLRCVDVHLRIKAIDFMGWSKLPASDYIPEVIECIGRSRTSTAIGKIRQHSWFEHQKDGTTTLRNGKTMRDFFQAYKIERASASYHNCETFASKPDSPAAVVSEKHPKKKRLAAAASLFAESSSKRQYTDEEDDDGVSAPSHSYDKEVCVIAYKKAIQERDEANQKCDALAWSTVRMYRTNLENIEAKVAKLEEENRQLREELLSHREVSRKVQELMGTIKAVEVSSLVHVVAKQTPPPLPPGPLPPLPSTPIPPQPVTPKGSDS
jgi:hypothetical protein